MSGFHIVALAEEQSADLDIVMSLDDGAREQALAATPANGQARYLQAAGAAVVPVRGVLLDEWSAAGPYRGATGYNYIRLAVEEAAFNPNVSITVLDINSPGGLVSGMQETASVIEAAGKSGTGKPIVALIRSLGASAAYALSAATDMIIASDSAHVGSIGARMQHISIQRLAENVGLKVTDITSHPKKADVSFFSDLSPSARARLQEGVDDAAAAFVDLVARRRGISADAVNALEAAVFPVRSTTGRKTALDHKLIDAVASADTALAEIVRLSRR